MGNSVKLNLPDEVFNIASKVALLANMPVEEVLERAFKLGIPLFETLHVSRAGLPVMHHGTNLRSYEEKIRSMTSSPINIKERVSQQEGSILLAYIRFLESYDGHPQRFFYRDPSIGRIIATPDTIDQLKKDQSAVFLGLASDVICAERQWVARWLCNTEDVALGKKKGNFDALKWLMERDHGWQLRTEVQPDLQRLVELFGLGLKAKDK